MQEQMIKNKRDIPKEEVQSERIVVVFFNQKLTIYCYLCFFRWSGIRCRGIHIDQQNRKESSDADQYQKWKFDL